MSARYNFAIGVILVACFANGVITNSIRPTRAVGNCNGGKGVYITYWNNDFSNPDYAQRQVADCFNKLTDKESIGGLPTVPSHSGCYTKYVGLCGCTVDSSFIGEYGRTFKDALNHLRSGTDNFRSIEAERYEGNMYLTYTCHN